MFDRYLHWLFLLMPNNSSRGIDVMPYFYAELFVWTLLFSCLHYLTPFVLKQKFPQWFQKLDSKKRSDISAYVICLIHHIVIVPRSWIHCFVDLMRSDSELASINYAYQEARVTPFCVGYLFGDTIGYAIPQALNGRFEYLVHHILSSSLALSIVSGPGEFNKLIPASLMPDITQLVYNISWLLKVVPFGQDKLALPSVIKCY